MEEENLKSFLLNTAKDYDLDIDIVTSCYWSAMVSVNENMYDKLEEYLKLNEFIGA